MKKYSAMVQALAGRYGWGVVISAFPYVNGLLVLTTALFCYLLCFVCYMFGVEIGPPEYTGNPIGWILYFLVMACYGWYIWSIIMCHLVFPLGAAVSMIDLIAGRKKNDPERYQGAVAGLALSVLPIALYIQGNYSDSALLAFAMPLLKPHGF